MAFSKHTGRRRGGSEVCECCGSWVTECGWVMHKTGCLLHGGTGNKMVHFFYSLQKQSL